MYCENMKSSEKYIQDHYQSLDEYTNFSKSQNLTLLSSNLHLNNNISLSPNPLHNLCQKTVPTNEAIVNELNYSEDKQQYNQDSINDETYSIKDDDQFFADNQQKEEEEEYIEKENEQAFLKDFYNKNNEEDGNNYGSEDREFDRQFNFDRSCYMNEGKSNMIFVGVEDYELQKNEEWVNTVIQDNLIKSEIGEKMENEFITSKHNGMNSVYEKIETFKRANSNKENHKNPKKYKEIEYKPLINQNKKVLINLPELVSKTPRFTEDILRTSGFYGIEEGFNPKYFQDHFDFKIQLKSTEQMVLYENCVICENDLLRLTPSVYLNDAIINFYLKLLLQEFTFKEEVENKYYIFNTYFFPHIRKLIDNAIKKNSEKNFKPINDYKIAHKTILENYEKLKKWHKLFKFMGDAKYIILPILTNKHWSVLIICNLPALKNHLLNNIPLPSSKLSYINPFNKNR